MKKLTLLVVSLFLSYMSGAQSLKVPAASPAQTVKQDFGLSSVEINYSRPGVKNRVIFGDIVPYNVVWRTGANAATTITFGDTVMVGGVKVSPGKYGLLSVPGEKEWSIIISRSTSVTSPDAYKQEDDVVRYKTVPIALSTKVETFTIQLDKVKPASCELQLMWDKTMVVLPIATDIDTRIMKDIQKFVVGDTRPYAAAANYYMDNDKDLKQALIWFDKALEVNPKAYWTWHQKANCYAKMGMKQEAIDTANKSIALAKEDQDDHYVMLNEKLIKSLK